jgi:hypothetical protein
MEVENALPYYDATTVTAVKSSIAHTHGCSDWQLKMYGGEPLFMTTVVNPYIDLENFCEYHPIFTSSTSTLHFTEFNDHKIFKLITFKANVLSFLWS